MNQHNMHYADSRSLSMVSSFGKESLLLLKTAGTKVVCAAGAPCTCFCASVRQLRQKWARCSHSLSLLVKPSIPQETVVVCEGPKTRQGQCMQARCWPEQPCFPANVAVTSTTRIDTDGAGFTWWGRDAKSEEQIEPKNNPDTSLNQSML